MGHRSIILLCAALCTCIASQVNALGLGKIQLESALNQPLNAKIELFEVRELTQEEIKVQIASRDDFDRIGIDKIYFLSDIKFEIVLEGPGAPYVVLTSKKLVREPFLNFLVQVQWPSGKLLREYTVLLDLPVFSGEAAPSVQTTASAPSQPSPSQPAQTQPVQTQSSSPQPSESYNPRSEYDAAPERPSAREVSPTHTEDTYQVRSNDTLWEIAAAVRPNRSVSIHQTMLAIQRENPEAFINNNINLLKSGQILRIPDEDGMENIAQREAVREVATQNAAWSGDDQEVSDVQLSGSNLYGSSSDDVSRPEGRLTLTSPDDAYDSNEGRSTGGVADSSTEALENELAITMEQLDKSSRENDDLRSKVSSLEEQINTMERMLEVSNENLRAIELSAQKNAEAAEALAADEALEAASTEEGIEDLYEDAPIDEEIADDYDSDYGSDYGSELGAEIDEALSSEEPVEDELESTLDESEVGELSDEISEELAEDVIEEEVEATPEATPNPKKVVIAPPPQEKGIVDIILDNILYIVGGIVVLAGGVFFLVRQKSSDEEDFDDFMEQHGLEEGASFDNEEDVAPPLDDEEDIDLGDFDGGEEAPAEELTEEFASDDAESEPQTEDVVTEADIYIAYGRFDRAEEMLVGALSNDPQDENVRLKLLEVYSTQGDGESFDPHYAKLRAFASPSTLERAETLRQSIPHIAEFDESSFDTSDVDKFSADDASADAGDIDLGDIEGDDLSLDLDVPSDDEEISLDLDIDAGVSDDLSDDISLDLDDETGADDDSLSLDLDLGDLDSDGDPDAGLDLDLDLPEDESAGNDISLDLGDIDDSAVSEDEVGDLDLDFDLDGDDDDSSDTSDDSGDLDLGIDFDSEPASDAAGDDLSLDTGLDFDLGDSDEGASSEDLSLDLDSGGAGANDNLDDLDLDLGGDAGGDSLDADLASLDADLDLSIDGDELDGDEEEQTQIQPRPEELDAALVEPSADLGDFDLGDADLGDLDLGEAGDSDAQESESDAPSFDIEGDLAGLDDGDLDLGADLDLSLDDSPVSSDTVVNEALNDEYIEQKLSEDTDLDMSLDEVLPLEDDLSPELTQAPAAELGGMSAEVEEAPVEEEASAPESDELDLSSLDQELDSLTADVDDAVSEVPTMEEPITDFDDFEDDLEKDEAMAETVKTDHVAEKPVEEMGEDTMFDQAIQEVPAPESDVEFELPEVNPDDIGDDDLDFLSDSDETATKLDLARAYIDMGDQEGARDIIREVMNEGNDQQKSEAEGLLQRLEG